jgi:hypothetical protein
VWWVWRYLVRSEGVDLLQVLDLLRVSGGALLFVQVRLRIVLVVEYICRGLSGSFVCKRRRSSCLLVLGVEEV